LKGVNPHSPHQRNLNQGKTQNVENSIFEIYSVKPTDPMENRSSPISNTEFSTFFGAEFNWNF